MKKSEVYAGALLLGAVAGMRSLAAPAMIGQFSRSGLLALEDSPLALLGGSKFGITSVALSAGEFIADKLPFIPNRTAAGPLAARAVSGALSGAALCVAKRRSVFLGVLLGSAGAIGAAYAAYELRKRAAQRLRVPDFALALAEDGVVAGTGMLVSSRLRRDS